MTRIGERAVMLGFEALARLRSARVFHPKGAMFSGTLRIDEAESLTGRMLGHGSWPALVRASKAIGTPRRWPDILGIAVRIHHTIGPVDLLFATVGRRLPFMLAPASDWASHSFSTLLPYRAAGQQVVLHMDPERNAREQDPSVSSIRASVNEWPLTFAFIESTGSSQVPIGQLTLHKPTQEEVSFDPVRYQHPGLKHSSLLAPLREWAYAGSRHGRSA